MFLMKSKKIIVFLAALILNGTMISSSYAQTAEQPGFGDVISVLRTIKADTTNILANVNNLPVYLNQLVLFCATWMNPDKSDESANLQANFSGLGSTVYANQLARTARQQELANDFLIGSGMQTVDKKGTKKTAYPDANDLIYQSLLLNGSSISLPVSPDPRGQDTSTIAYNYIKNAAAFNIRHALPDDPSWTGGDPIAQERYREYFKTVNAIQTFNAYLLTELYSNSLNNNQLSTQQNQLMQQASDSANWFAKVASEDLGIVLRQILMYSSQQYVLLVQLLQTQREQVAAQAMTNSLLIVGNQFTESQLLSKAIKK